MTQSRTQTLDELRRLGTPAAAILSGLPQWIGGQHPQNRQARADLAGAYRLRQHERAQPQARRVECTSFLGVELRPPLHFPNGDRLNLRHRRLDLAEDLVTVQE